MSILIISSIAGTIFLVNHSEKTLQVLHSGNETFLRFSESSNSYQNYYHSAVLPFFNNTEVKWDKTTILNIQSTHRQLLFDVLDTLRNNTNYINTLSIVTTPETELPEMLNAMYALQENIVSILNSVDKQFNYFLTWGSLPLNHERPPTKINLYKDISDIEKHLWTINNNTYDMIQTFNRHYQNYILLITLLSLILLSITFILVFNTILPRLRDIINITQAIQSESELPPVNTEIKDEIGEIITTLSLLHRQLKSSKAIIRTKNKELNHYAKHLKELNANLIEAIENERRDISQFIHNNLGQYLTAIHFELEWLKRQSPSKEIAESIEKPLQLIQTSLNEIKNISHHIHPPLIQELGFEGAIKTLLKNYSNLPFTIHFDCNIKSKVISEQQLITLYRSIQECMTNVARHSQAKSVTIQCYETADGLSLAILDDGKGLPEKPYFSMGVRTLESRVSYSQGKLELKNRENGGLAVTITLPKEFNYD